MRTRIVGTSVIVSRSPQALSAAIVQTGSAGYDRLKLMPFMNLTRGCQTVKRND